VTAFAGLRVLDLTCGELGLAGAFFADFGAEVIAVGLDADRPVLDEPAELFWGRGKRTVSVDPDDTAQVEALHGLAAAADVVIDGRPDRTTTALALSSEALRGSSPGLVYCQILGFGDAAGLDDFGPREYLVCATSGRLLGRDALSGAPGDMDRPIYSVAPVGTYGAAMLAVQGIIAALIKRRATGQGSVLETSVLDGLSAGTMRLAFERNGDEVVPSSRRDGGGIPLLLRGIRLCFLTVECADGKFIQMCCRQPHLYRNWMRLTGLDTEMTSERWAQMPLGVKSVADAAEWEAKVRRAMLAHTQAEWMDLFRATDIGADPFLTEPEFLAHPQMVENDRVATVANDAAGDVTMVGTLVRADATPARVTAGVHAGSVTDVEWSARPAGDMTAATPESPGGPAALPLAGYTILEAATYLAAPLGATLLARLGARVIKVEPLEGDSFRSSGLEFVHICSGKESIALDLKRPEARRILDELIGMSDAVIHNFRPGVPERLGLDYDHVHRVNPRTAYVYGSSYGSSGPESYRAAFHSTPNALSGGGIAQAGQGNAPVNDSYPDPVAGLAAGVALALGLYTSSAQGSGQYLETTMLASTGWLHSSRLVAYDGRSAPPVLDARQLGLHPLQRLYATADGWLLIDVRTRADQAALVAVARGAGFEAVATLAAEGASSTPPVALTSALEAMFATRPTAEWEPAARDAGLPAVRADEMTFEEYLVAHGMVSSAEHPAFGSYWQLNDRVRFEATVSTTSPACAVGEHTREILSELGYPAADIDDLVESMVAGVPDVAKQGVTA
jgi:crotonobetainyl-CoA:carnitine CoA-transferase CaiB-like acyl-CoA transferase